MNARRDARRGMRVMLPSKSAGVEIYRYQPVATTLLPRWVHWLKNLILVPYKVIREHLGGDGEVPLLVRVAGLLSMIGYALAMWVANNVPRARQHFKAHSRINVDHLVGHLNRWERLLDQTHWYVEHAYYIVAAIILIASIFRTPVRRTRMKQTDASRWRRKGAQV